MTFADELEKNPIFKTVADVSQRIGCQSFIVGGYVRDIILKRPSKDIDFVCVGSGIELAEAIAKNLGKNVQVNIFKNFGTAQIRFNDLELEFVGARKES